MEDYKNLLIFNKSALKVLRQQIKYDIEQLDNNKSLSSGAKKEIIYSLKSLDCALENTLCDVWRAFGD